MIGSVKLEGTSERRFVMAKKAYNLRKQGLTNQQIVDKLASEGFVSNRTGKALTAGNVSSLVQLHELRLATDKTNNYANQQQSFLENATDGDAAGETISTPLQDEIDAEAKATKDLLLNILNGNGSIDTQIKLVKKVLRED
jgi:hypothetical protein